MNGLAALRAAGIRIQHYFHMRASHVPTLDHNCSHCSHTRPNARSSESFHIAILFLMTITIAVLLYTFGVQRLVLQQQFSAKFIRCWATPPRIAQCCISRPDPLSQRNALCAALSSTGNLSCSAETNCGCDSSPCCIADGECVPKYRCCNSIGNISAIVNARQAQRCSHENMFMPSRCRAVM